MKTTILTSAIIFATVAVTFAQTTPVSDNATLNVNLASVRTIEVLAPTVDIDVVTANDYVAAAGTGTGVSTAKASHLKVVSTGAFKVTASSTTDLIGQTDGAESISKANIYLLADNPVTAVGDALDVSTATERSLASTDPIIETTNGTTGTEFDVKYTLKGQSDIASLSDQTYTTTVIYTLEDN